MTAFAIIFSKTLAVLTIFGNALALFLVACFFLKNTNDLAKKIINFFGRLAIPLSFFVAAGATIGSLIYSEALNFPPCPFCWYQRIFMYSLAIILAIAWYRKDEIGPYVFWLASIGGFFSLYHYLLEFGLVPSALCSAEAISCAQRLVFEFGFVSIPWMTLSGFILIILFFIAKKQSR
jgi:disulfide bond formation protein DsbB